MVQAQDILAAKRKIGGEVIIIGGGIVGMEAAEYLAERGCKVTVLEMLADYCTDLGTARKICVAEHIQDAGILPVTGVRVTQIKDHQLSGNKDGVELRWSCDYVVTAVGAVPRDGKKQNRRI